MKRTFFEGRPGIKTPPKRDHSKNTAKHPKKNRNPRLFERDSEASERRIKRVLSATIVVVIAVGQEIPEVLINHFVGFAGAEDFVVFAEPTDKSAEHGFQATRIVPDLVGAEVFAIFETFRVTLQGSKQWFFITEIGECKFLWCCVPFR